jgi:uncharacterized membrane protein HdeD (DUF308 family)
MAKHPLSSIIVGIVFLIGGLTLILVGLIVKSEEILIPLLIYGIPLLIIGIILLLWKKEDDIEKRKDFADTNKKIKMKGGSKK